MTGFSRKLALAAVLAGAIGGMAPVTTRAQATPDSSEAGLRRLVADYIDLYRRESLAEWRKLFLPSFVVAFPSADGSITARTLEQFFAAQERGFERSPDMAETLDSVRIERRGALASVWAGFVFTSGGVSRRGRLVMLCLRERGGWKIHSLLFSYLE